MKNTATLFLLSLFLISSHLGHTNYQKDIIKVMSTSSQYTIEFTRIDMSVDSRTQFEIIHENKQVFFLTQGGDGNLYFESSVQSESNDEIIIAIDGQIDLSTISLIIDFQGVKETLTLGQQNKLTHEIHSGSLISLEINNFVTNTVVVK